MPGLNDIGAPCRSGPRRPRQAEPCEGFVQLPHEVWHRELVLCSGVCREGRHDSDGGSGDVRVEEGGYVNVAATADAHVHRAPSERECIDRDHGPPAPPPLVTARTIKSNQFKQI